MIVSRLTKRRNRWTQQELRLTVRLRHQKTQFVFAESNYNISNLGNKKQTDIIGYEEKHNNLLHPFWIVVWILQYH